MESTKLVKLVALVLAAVCIITGTSLLWNDRANIAVTPEASETRHQFNWNNTLFYLVWLLAAAGVFLNQGVFAVGVSAIAYGIATFRENNLASFAYINQCRVNNGYESTRDSATRRCTAGGIIAYAGLIICIVLSATPLTFEATVFKDKVMALIATILAIVGLVLSWASYAAGAPPGLALAAGNVYYSTIDVTVVTFLATAYTVLGVFSSSPCMRMAAGFLAGLAFVTIFESMFIVVLNTDDDNQIYAGFIFSWFAVMADLAIAIHSGWASNTRTSAEVEA